MQPLLAVVRPWWCVVCAVVLISQEAPAQPTDDAWPHPIPCRVQDGDNDDLFVIMLGDVETPLAQGVFDPAKDVVTLHDGTTIENYYRDKLGLEFYRPIEKSQFPLPPSGWCTWYYYYPNITARETKRNARWIAENLKEFGAEYVQIDDGWQGSGARDGGRDWSQTNPRRFPDGMQELAQTITAEGLKPGIWLAPHGQSNQQLVDDNPHVFLLDKEGKSLSDTWEGKFLLDPRSEASQKYLRDLFTKLRDWGYVYYKIDGQPIVVNEYARLVEDENHELYRQTLQTIRDAIGAKSYLLGCWGIPTQGMGIMNGSRTGGDIVRGWSGGFLLAAGATMRNYYQHNVAWYTDPDTMVLRSPLTIEQARAWATLQGLTGQALMSSDRLTDLNGRRVELLRRVYPAVDARPLDLFPTNGRIKRIWDLKVNHLGRNYDVVGVFNYDEDRSEQIYLKWQDLGLTADKIVHVFDFWNQEYLGAWEVGMMVDVPPASVRVLTLLPSSGLTELISTNRHITQGWIDLENLEADAQHRVFEGLSNVIRNDPYELIFVFPRGKGFAVKSASAKSATGVWQSEVENHQGWATVRWTPRETTQISWRVEFEPADLYYYRPEPVTNLRVEPVGIDGVRLNWNELYWLNAGYKVYLDGKALGYTPRAQFSIDKLDPKVSHKAEVATVWENGSESQRKPEITFTVAALLPGKMQLANLQPIPSTERRRFFGPAGSTDAAITIDGVRYQNAITVRNVSYDLKGLFDKFSAVVAVAAEEEDSVSESFPWRFVVLGDEKELWSGTVAPGDEAVPVDVDTAGVSVLKLTVSATGSPSGASRGRRRRGGPTPAWLEAKVKRTQMSAE